MYPLSSTLDQNPDFARANDPAAPATQANLLQDDLFDWY